MLRGTDAAIEAPESKHCVHSLHALPDKWNKIVSPGFPNGINTQIQCSWMITSNPGYRIKLAFRTLNVTGSRRSCFTQFVEIFDYKIGHSAGKFCGASRPGDYVSWGTRVRFDLQGDTSGENTEGFDLRYIATKEPGGFKTHWTFPLKPKKGGTKKAKKPKAGKPKRKNKGPESSASQKPMTSQAMLDVITVAEKVEVPLNIYIIAGVAAGGVVALTIIFILNQII
uniref:dorsal-ventral patterning tolloid-like protein 1 n=1 Tax=Styela clava TaxID=7725 RepID=UPI001939BB1D|nr:dorsal-ventral patterning tolloid-like protein 1 [Styela clava]